uniref:(northern house mosquito) hypothetical protein n=1 Tax=Culex pipiens TaxID=7175 RepID=A0A8D8FEX4_CULPI
MLPLPAIGQFFITAIPTPTVIGSTISRNGSKSGTRPPRLGRRRRPVGPCSPSPRKCFANPFPIPAIRHPPPTASFMNMTTTPPPTINNTITDTINTCGRGRPEVAAGRPKRAVCSAE